MAVVVSRIFWYVLARILSYKPIADFIIKHGQKGRPFHLYRNDGSLYMGRWWVVRWERLRNLLPAIRLHHIADRDRDRHVHDHPWNYRTIVLRGWYLEANANDEFRFIGDCGFCPRTVGAKAGNFHRIAYVPEEGAWTLFITWKWRHVWGFLVDGHKVPHELYESDVA